MTVHTRSRSDETFSEQMAKQYKSYASAARPIKPTVQALALPLLQTAANTPCATRSMKKSTSAATLSNHEGEIKLNSAQTRGNGLHVRFRNVGKQFTFEKYRAELYDTKFPEKFTINEDLRPTGAKIVPTPIFINYSGKRDDANKLPPTPRHYSKQTVTDPKPLVRDWAPYGA